MLHSPSPNRAAHARGTPRTARIAVAAERRYLDQLQPAGLIEALALAGHAPHLLDPEDAPASALEGVDVLVARGRSPALLALLGRAEAAGVATVNRRAGVAAVLDKAAMARRLAAAGIPSPATRTAPIHELVRTARAADFPLVVKPVRGDNARDVRIVSSREELAALRWTEAVALAQRLVPSDGHDLKLYVAGAAIWAIRKPSPISPHRGGPASPRPLTPALAALARRCGRLFGLELFGVDCIETARGAVVIEVNDFPNYTGVPGAGERLAHHVLARAGARGSGRPS